MTAILETRALVSGYGKKRAVHGVDLALNTGEILLVLGHNGAGKTTLMSTIFGLIRPMEGQVLLEGRDISGRTPAANVADGIAYVPQGHGIFKTLTVRDNLELGAFSETDAARTRERLEQVFSLFPILKERAGQVAGTFSGGQQQMLAIARALMLRPRLMLLDEPSFGLAPLIVQDIFAILARINREDRVSMLVVEQNTALALELADYAYVLETGRVVMSGPADEIASDESVRRSYLGY